MTDIFNQQLQASRKANPELSAPKKKAWTDEEIEAYEQRQCDRYNNMPGTLGDGVDCDICKNKGVVEVYEHKEHIMRRCSCMDKRLTVRRMKSCGLGDVFEFYRFDNYNATEPWQAKIKNRAEQFVKDPARRLFFLGGQPGCGKTHICTAVCAELIKQGKQLRYTPWRDLLSKLMAVRFDEKEFFAELKAQRDVQVLYIDDLFKTQNGEAFSRANMKTSIEFAFDIINARYSMGDKITIISSEHTTDAIKQLDNAIASRIYEMAGNYKLNIGWDDTRNYRWKL